MTGRVMIYGANGFSGGLLVAALADLGPHLVVAGRDPAVARLAHDRGLDWRCFALDDPALVAAALADVAVVLNCAGPFRATAAPLVAACLETGTDYLDLAGEWPVFAAAIARSAEAAAAGVMLLPGVGFSIAASDCLLALAARTPGCVRLRLALSRPRRIARGSLQTILELNDTVVRVRRNGAIAELPAGRLAREFDFGHGPRHAVAVTWPDVFTAATTTGIDSIETYAEAGWAAQAAIRLGAMVAPLTRSTAAAPWLRAISALCEPEPAEIPGDPGFVLVAEAEDRWRTVTTLRLHTDDGYATTTASAAAAVRRVLAGTRTPGFTTPAALFGADFILGLGCAELLEPGC